MHALFRFSQIGMVVLLSLTLSQCQGPDKKPTNGTDFNPDINVGFHPSKIHRQPYFYVRSKPKHNVTDNTLIPAVKNGKLSAYETAEMEKAIGQDSLSHYTSGSDHYLLHAGLEWEVLESQQYGAPHVNFVRVGQSLFGKTRGGKYKFYLSTSSLDKVLNQTEKEKLNAQFYQQALKEPLNRAVKDITFTANQVPEQHTVRPISWKLKPTPVSAYFNSELKAVNQKLQEKVKAGGLTAYKTPSLEESPTDALLTSRCKGDTSTVAYRPYPIKRPRYVKDTTIVEQCKPEQIRTYLVLEKWQSNDDELYDFRPEVKAIAPVVQPSNEKRAYYWLKWKEVKTQLAAEDSKWLKKYFLHGLKGDL